MSVQTNAEYLGGHNMDKTAHVRKFGMRDKLGYMFGDFGNDFTFILSSMFLLKFYTDVMGVSAGLVGTMMMVARFVDAFTDVTMGQIVDRSKTTAKGKFAPWIRRICGPVALASFLMYASWFQDMPMAFKVFWMFFTYLLWGSICYTGINIPYGSMASAISAEPKHRAQLSNWRTIGATLAGTFIGVVLPMLVYYTDAEGRAVFSSTRMTIAAGVCSILAVICYILCYKLTTERVKMPESNQKFSLSMLAKSVLTNRSLIGIIVAALLVLFGQLSLQSMNNYIFPNYFGNPSGISIAQMMMTVISLILATCTVALSTKFGRKELAISGALISAIAMTVGYFLQTTNMTVFLAVYAFASLGFNLFSFICWAMITDVIDDTEVQTGVRQDGTIYSVYSFARKCGQAFASGITGAMLSAIGYTQATAYDADVVKGIYNVTCLIPAIAFFVLAIALFFLYPLNKKRVEENAAELARRRNQA